MNHVRQQKSAIQDFAGLSQDLRTLAEYHVEIGRELQLLADRIERRDWDGVGEARRLGEVAESIVARIVRGEMQDDG